ncbi:MAG: type III polyketide synthase [Lachnospiraceae bacterium]|nr:type III polyketide synthase [Lachnospiraceae bacterium]
MEEPNELAKSIAATDPIATKLDNNVKNLFANRPMLSRVIKETVLECKDMSYEEIEACIEGEIHISEVYVDPGLSNASERINGINTEMYVNGEGLVKFDLFTYIRLPGDIEGDLIKIYLNLEFMNEDKPGYDISIRALFYCCRMISMQESVEFTVHKDDPVKYGNIKKVYSVWICTESAQKRANTIEKYGINRSFLLGYNNDSPRYDIMNAVIIYISKTHDAGNTDNGLVRMLTDLFNETTSATEKIKKLKDKHGILMTREILKEVPEMCTYAEAMVLKGIEQGRQDEMANTEREKRRADAAEARIKELEEKLALAVNGIQSEGDT